MSTKTKLNVINQELLDKLEELKGEQLEKLMFFIIETEKTLNKIGKLIGNPNAFCKMNLLLSATIADEELNEVQLYDDIKSVIENN